MKFIRFTKGNENNEQVFGQNQRTRKIRQKTIVLPESMDARTFEAAEKILKEGIANLIIIGTPEEIEKNSKGYDISGAKIIDPLPMKKQKTTLTSLLN